MRVLNLFRCFLVSMVFMLASNSAYAIENPVDMLNQTIVKVQNELAQNKKLKNMSVEQLHVYLKDTLMPYLAIKQMAAMTVGPMWRSATPEQRDEFIDAFGMMLTRTYASALLKVNDVVVSISPLHTDDWKSKKRVVVRGTVAREKGAEGSQVNYYLRRTKEDKWIVYDVAIEGVSFVKNYNEQFAGFSTMKELLDKLRTINNEKLESANSQAS